MSWSGFSTSRTGRFDEIRALAARPATSRAESFDYYCWDLYAQVGAWYEADRVKD
jgi:hypothetical protein